MTARRLRYDQYTVGWVCAIPIELAAAKAALDETHLNLPVGNDPNSYTLGRIGNNNVVISCLPAGRIGITSATALAIHMQSSFPSIQFGLMVGVGGGVPSTDSQKDVRLGDVVVSQPGNGHGGVVQYDFGKSTPGGFEITRSLNKPPDILLNASAALQANSIRGENKFQTYLSGIIVDQPQFSRDNAGDDILFSATYDHIGGDTCSQCNKDMLVQRTSRENRNIVKVHYGAIASANRVVRYAKERDDLSNKVGGVLCFEMEAAGLMDRFPCLVIRGICDYADSHKNKTWQPYAAATAAAYAKEMLSIINTTDIPEAKLIDGITRGERVSNHSGLID
jgi:nucleoside phosphorylase